VTPISAKPANIVRGTQPIQSNLFGSSFCIEALDDALSQGQPEIFNTDQGSQFTGDDFTEVLRVHGIAISMDGRGDSATTSSSNGFGAASNNKPGRILYLKISRSLLR
jgi:hypothetical protein